MKILIADDSKTAVRMLKNLLIQMKIEEIEVAENGKEALRLLETMEPLPNVILLDIIMPIMDGIKTLKKIRSHPGYNTIKVILISSEGNRRIILDTLHHGANDFIVKPIMQGALEKKLKQLFPKGLFIPSTKSKYISEGEYYTNLKIPKHLSYKNIDKFEFEFSSFIKPQGKEFVLDMGNVDYLYSKGFRLIAFLSREILRDKGKVSIVNMNESVEKLIKGVNLHKMIPVFRTLKEFETKKNIITKFGQK